MPVNKLFGGVLGLAKNVLDLRLERQGLIHSNLANINTPGYTTRDFSFSDALKSAMTGQGQLARTNAAHLQVKPAEVTAAVKDSRRPVDLDEEMLKLSENGLMYQVTAKIIAKKLEGIRWAIDEGGK